MPAAVKWAIGITWFHAALAVPSVIWTSRAGRTNWTFLILVLGVAYVVVALGLSRGHHNAWWAAIVLSVLSILTDLMQGRISVGTQVAVLILLLLPSSREAFQEPAEVSEAENQ